MKNISSTFIYAFCFLFFSTSQLKAQFDSLPFHSSKKITDHSFMYEADLGGGFMKDEFFSTDNNYSIGYGSQFHLFYKAQVGLYYPAVKIGKTGTFGPTLDAGIGLTRRSFNELNIPLGIMIRFGNNSNAITKKAWGYGIGISIAPTIYNDRAYSHGPVLMKVPMMSAQISTQNASIRLDFLPFPMDRQTSVNALFRIDSDVSLTMCYSFGNN